jgi:hypothetical protein
MHMTSVKPKTESKENEMISKTAQRNAERKMALLKALQDLKVIWDREGVGSDDQESDALYTDLCIALKHSTFHNLNIVSKRVLVIFHRDGIGTNESETEPIYDAMISNVKL